MKTEEDSGSAVKISTLEKKHQNNEDFTPTHTHVFLTITTLSIVLYYMNIISSEYMLL